MAKTNLVKEVLRREVEEKMEDLKVLNWKEITMLILKKQLINFDGEQEYLEVILDPMEGEAEKYYVKNYNPYCYTLDKISFLYKLLESIEEDLSKAEDELQSKEDSIYMIYIDTMKIPVHFLFKRYWELQRSEQYDKMDYFEANEEINKIILEEFEVKF